MIKIRIFLVSSFFMSVLAGFWSGTQVFRIEKHETKQASYPYLRPTKVPGDQDGIFIIVIDNLNGPKPKLEGVWLFTYITNYVAIKPLPLYPSENSLQDDELVKSFQLTSNYEIAKVFWDFLQNHGHPVRDYILVDEIALVALINLFGGITIQGKYMLGPEVLDSIPNSWDDPIGSMIGQIAVIDSMCKSVLHSNPTIDWHEFHVGIKDHLVSNLDLEVKSQEWQKIIASGKYKVCDFPDHYEKLQVSVNP